MTTPSGQPWGRPDHTNPGSGLGGIGEWLGASVTAVGSNLVPLVLLLFVPRAITTVVARAIGVLADPNWPFGLLSGSALGANLVIGVIVSVVTFGFYLAATHLLYTVHTGRTPTIDESMSVGFRRLPRAIAWGVLLLVPAVVAAGLLGASAGPADAGSLVVVLPLLAAMLYVVVRLAFWTAAVTVDTSTDPYSASLAATRGRWLAVFGRLVLVGIALWILAIVFGSILVPVAGALQRLIPGGLALDYVVTGPLDEVSTAAAAAFQISATTALYRRAGGPSRT